MSLHLPRDHYNLPGPVMKIPLQGPAGSRTQLKIWDNPVAQKSKESLSFPTQRKDTGRQRQGRPPGGRMRDLQTSGPFVGQRQQNMAEWPQQSFEELNWFTSQLERDTQDAVICNEKEWVFPVESSRERGQKWTKGGWDLTSRLTSSFC